MQFYKFATKSPPGEESAGRDEYDARSRERALNTAAFKGPRNPSSVETTVDMEKHIVEMERVIPIAP